MRPTNGQSTDDQTTARPFDGRPASDRPTARRVTVAEAAVLLGLSEDAVRSRLKRGTLRKEKARDGTVLVILGTDGVTDRPTAHNDRPKATDQAAEQPTDQGDLVEILREQLEYMREQVDQEREANRENRRIIAGLVQRVPELEAAPETRESPQTASEEQGGSRDHPEGKGSERRSWWKRLLDLE